MENDKNGMVPKIDISRIIFISSTPIYSINIMILLYNEGIFVKKLLFCIVNKSIDAKDRSYSENDDG